MEMIREQFSAPSLLPLIPNSAAAPLLLDIETTGLSSARDRIYLIGCAWETGQEGTLRRYELRQFFAQNTGEETAMLRAFLEFFPQFSSVVHFNGDRFDLPFIRKRALLLGLGEHPGYQALCNAESIDLCRIIKPYRSALGLPDGTQRSLEKLLNTGRTDEKNGGELIKVYHGYERTRDAHARAMLLLHNADDVRGLPALSAAAPLLSFIDEVRNGTCTLSLLSASGHDYRTLAGDVCTEAYLSFSLSSPVPTALHHHREGLYLQIEGNTGRLRAPLISCELKHFFRNYKNYDYLPAEDRAVHHSVSQFVDRSHRVQANAANCYVRKESRFLPLPQLPKKYSLPDDLPVFRESFDNPRYYMEFRPEKEKDMARYLSHVLKMLFS